MQAQIGVNDTPGLLPVKVAYGARNAVHTEQNFTVSGLLKLLRIIAVGVLCGVGFGLVMSIVSNGFVIGVKWLTEQREGLTLGMISVGGLELSVAPLLSLLLAACLILLVRRIFGISRWHGPADSIYAAHRTDNELDVKSGFGSTVAAFISASGGASVGQYGPLVHFGATMGSFLRQITGGALTTDVFIGCGVAGAIAAGFNAPIAGVVFAHEAILRHFSMRAIAPIAVASISAVWFSDRIFGSSRLFSVDAASLDMSAVLPAALAVGPVFGIVAVVFMLAIRHSARLAAGSGWSPARLVLSAACITGLIGMAVPEILGLGTGPLAAMLDGEFDLKFLMLLLVLKIAATALCIGFGLFGGVFSPALFVGAAAGAIGGRILAGLGLAGGGPALAVCGMAAVASAVIGAPVSGVIIILELTMSYEFALAAMLSVMVSIILSNHLFGHSFFDRQLQDRGIDVALGRGHIEMMETPVATVVSTQFPRIGPESTVGEAIDSLVSASATEAYITDDSGLFHGKVSLHTLLKGSRSTAANSLADTSALSIKHDASLQQAIEAASNFVGESIPVVNRDTGEMLGVVTEADLFQLYLGLQTRIADLERA